MNFDTLNTKQQDYIRNLYDGIVREAQDAEIDVEIRDSYPRQWLKFMSSKYCDMNWAPAWIVKDKTRQQGKGSYMVPELKQYHDTVQRDELPKNDGETVIIGTEVVAA